MTVPCPDCSSPVRTDPAGIDAAPHLTCVRCGHRFLPTGATRRRARAEAALDAQREARLNLARVGIELQGMPGALAESTDEMPLDVMVW